ncbi:unnamed protein product [Amoebophrya sp. A120]|nr:unnamed protein product [Amoebophrya sp. A120]|eukprot:GSA120T00007617001.1
MTQKIFVDVSSARVQTLLEHTEHKGAKELDLDILYKLVNEQQQKISCNASAEITSSGTKAASDLSSGEVREGAGGPGVKKTKTASDVACTGEVLRTTKADCIGRKMTSEEPDGCDLSSVSTTPSSEVCTSSTEEHDASKPREATTVASDGDDFFCSDRSTLCTAASSTAPLNSTSSTAATEADVGHTSSIAAVDQPRKIQRNAGDEGMMQKTDQFATPAASLAEIIAQDCQIIRRETVPDHRELSEIEVLRLKQEERAYQKSVANVTAHGRHTARKEIKAATEGMALAGHFVLSFVGAFLCGYILLACILQLFELPSWAWIVWEGIRTT